MLKNILFTHDDMDGVGCKIVYTIARSNLLPSDYSVVICSNKDIDGKVLDYIDDPTWGCVSGHTDIYFADICPSRDVIQRLIDERYRVYVYDHHLSNTWVTELISDAVVTPESQLGRLESGTSLLYQAFADGIMAMNINHDLLGNIVDTIRSYDTYEWKKSNNIEAKKLNLLFTMVGFDNFFNRYIGRIRDVNDNGELISSTDLEFVDCSLNREQRIIDKFSVNDVIDLEIRGYRVAFLMGSVGANVSELAYQFLEKHPEFDVFVQFGMYEGGSFAFRTRRDDLDVGKEFAVPLGGGGHPKASGSHLPEFIEEAFKDALIRWMRGQAFCIKLVNE